MPDISDLNEQFKQFSSKALGKIDGYEESMKEFSSRLLAMEQKRVSRNDGGDLGGDVGRKVVESERFKSFVASNGRRSGPIEIGSFYTKTDLLNSNGQNQPLVPSQRRPGVVAPGQQQLTVRDLLPNYPTQSNMIEFAAEDSHTDGTAVQSAEGAAKGESALRFELLYSPIRTIATWLPASKQILDDAAGLSAYINGRLRYFLALKEENEILNGTGAGVELSGLVANADIFDTSVVNPSTDTFIDVLGLALSQCAASKFQPDGIVLNPKDWSRIQRIKTATTNEYVFANPHLGAGNQLWGVTVVPSWSMAESQFLVGAFQQGAAVWDRQSATFEVSREHDDFFVRNMVALLVESRLTVTVYRGDCFVYGGFPFGS